MEDILIADSGMAFRDEKRSVSSSTTREVFSGPERNSMCKKTILEATLIGESMYQGSEPMTTDICHMFRDAPVNPHPQSKASWVGAVGWDVATEYDKPKERSENQIKKSEFRQEVERKATSYPKVI